MKMAWYWVDVIVTQHCDYHWIALLKKADFMLYEFHLHGKQETARCTSPVIPATWKVEMGRISV
jgi:hypothetical protein